MPRCPPPPAAYGTRARRCRSQRRGQKTAPLLRDLSRYKFVPIAVETSGVLGPATSKVIRELGQLITARTGERRETEWLRKRLSMALVRGNAAAVLATATTDRAKGRLPPPPPVTASPLASAAQTEPYSRSEPPSGEPSTSARPAAEAV